MEGTSGFCPLDDGAGLRSGAGVGRTEIRVRFCRRSRFEPVGCETIGLPGSEHINPNKNGPVIIHDWCATCCTRHALNVICPGELPQTGPELHGWRVNAETPRGTEAFGVMVAPSHDVWRARILTYPNVIWLVPGGQGSLKFVGPSRMDAESQAVQFIRQHCRSRKFVMRDDGAPSARQAPRQASPATPAPPRKIRFLPIRFGLFGATEVGGTGNLSKSGLFVLTESPIEPGTKIRMALDLTNESISLAGYVRWMRKRHRVGGAPGMGIQLEAPPRPYLDFVRNLP
jgi:hypothetical protein